jgi:hypothetical protein
MNAGRYVLALRLVVAVISLPLLWLALLWVTWIPVSRPLSVTVSAQTPTTLTVFRDIGREFYPGDAVRRDVVAGTTTIEFALPTEARALRLELSDPTAFIEKVSLGGLGLTGLAGAAVAANRHTVTTGALPPLGRPPFWLAFACAVAALGLAGATLSRRGSVLIAGAWKRLARPEVQVSFRGTAVTWFLFASLLLALGVCADAYDVLYGHIDNPPHWPVSVFDPRTPSLAAVAVAALALVAAQLVFRRAAPAQKGSIPLAMGMCVCALIAGNLLGGWQAGFVEPTAGPVMYLADARSISSVRDFLATFVERQPQLRLHGRTHPPGAELLYYALFRCLGSAGAIALVLGVGSMLFASACVYGNTARPRQSRTALGCSGGAALAYGALYVATGFNWISSLLVATRLENRNGFGLLSHPGTYVFTRIECGAELALFAGPTLLTVWLRGLAIDRGVDVERRELNVLSLVGLGTLCSMFVAGAFKTGETARACLFFYPFIALPAAAIALVPDVQRRLVMMLLTQAFVMQIVGDYYW